MARNIFKITAWNNLLLHNNAFSFLRVCPKRYRYKTNVNVESRLMTAVNKHGEKYYYNKDAFTKRQKKVTIQTIQEILNLNNISAVDVADRWPDIYKVFVPEIVENIKILKGHDITNETIIKYPYLIGADNIDKKIDILKDLPYKVNEIAPLIHYTIPKLMSFIDKELEALSRKHGGRIDFLCRKVECTPDVASDILLRHNFLTKYSYSRLENNLNILFRYGITLEAIMRDCWVLAYTPTLIESRLELAKQSQVVELKTWMVRCPSNIMNNCIQRKQSNKSILGTHSIAEYLSDRLECTLDEAKTVIVKNKPLQTKSIVKLKEILDWLYSQGFQPYQVQRVPRILLHSMQTIKTRVKCLTDLGYSIDSLVYLLKSKDDFQKFTERIELKKNKAVTGSDTS